MSLRLIKHQCVGQASFEALLVISLGLSLLVSIQVVGNLRSVTLDLLAESRFLSSLPQAELQMQQLAAHTLADEALYSTQQRTIERQVGFDSSRVLRATAHAKPAAPLVFQARTNRLQQPLKRHSFLVSGAGSAHSTQEAQNTIAQSESLWQKPALESKALIAASALRLTPIDLAWGRAKVTTDWLLPWAAEVPERAFVKP